MPQYKHILTDFKDLRKVIGEVTKSTPAKTRYQQQAEKMSYQQQNEAEAQPVDKNKASKLKKQKDHAGEEEIKKAYMALGRSAQGSVEFQRKLIQKQLKKMGFKTYSKMAFDTIFNRPITKEDLDKFFTITESFTNKQLKGMRRAYKGLGKVDPMSPTGKKLLDKFRTFSKDELLQLAAAGINFLSILAASNLITRFGMKSGDFKFDRSAVHTEGTKQKDEYVVLDTGLEKALKKFKVKFSKDLKNIDEGGMKRLFTDLEQGATAQQISKKYGIDMKTAKSFVDDYKKVSQAPRLRAAENDPLKEGKFSSSLINKAIAITKDKKYKGGDYDGAVKAIEKLKKGLSDDPKVAKALYISANYESVKEATIPSGLRKIDGTIRKLSKHKFAFGDVQKIIDDYETVKDRPMGDRRQENLQKALKFLGDMVDAGIDPKMIMRNDFVTNRIPSFYVKNQKLSKFTPNDLNKAKKAAQVESVDEGKYAVYSDLLLMKARIIDKEGPNSNKLPALNHQIKVVMKRLGIKEENIQEGTWKVPHSTDEMKMLNKMMKKPLIIKTSGDEEKAQFSLGKYIGDDNVYDDWLKMLKKYEDGSAAMDARDAVVKFLKEWGFKVSNYQITHYPESILEDRLQEKGNLKKPKRSKLLKLDNEPSRSQQVKEEHEHAKQSPFKLKSQQYPRAIAVNTDGFGNRHATVEDIILACDSFGMILDKELQVEQIQKQLGKKGFISFKQSDLEDVFESRETERMILALESDVEEQGPIEYTKNEITEAFIMGEEIEFLKPDGLKAAGPVLKKGGNTFNVKDKFTGKSFTYKYSDKENVKIEEEKVKTFKQITEIELGPNMLRKDFPNVWATKDSKLYRVLAWLISMHGFTTNLSSYKKDKKGFLDSLRSIAKSDANMRKAGMSSRDVQYIKNPKPDQNFAEDIQEGRFSKQLIKQAGGIAFDKRYYMGNMSGAVKAIEKLKKGLSDDPKVREMLRIANESNETTDYTNWLPEGGDKEAYQKFFNKALKKFGVSSPDELEGEKKKKFFDYVDKNWKGDHEEVEFKLDGRRKNFREKMKKLGYIKGQ